MHVSEKWKWIAQSCPTLSDPVDCSPPGSSIHGIFQARVLEWDAIAFSIMTCIHHYNIMQSIVTALKVLCALPIHLSRHWSLAATNPFTVYIVSTFLEHPVIAIIRSVTFFRLAFYLVTCLCGLIAHFFLVVVLVAQLCLTLCNFLQFAFLFNTQ